MPEATLDEVFWAVHSDLKREGPGDEASTRRAFVAAAGLPPRPAVLDVGCGPGGQTLTLAALTDGAITAVDNHQPFLDNLAAAAAERGLSGRITALNASMSALPFPDRAFDLIWSEGAAYLMGFDKAVAAWRRHLKPGGWLAVSEACWLAPPDQIPEAARASWAEYPAMTTADGVAAQVEAAGYRLANRFTLSPEAWWTYYGPVEARIAALREAFAGDADRLARLETHQREVDDYRRFGHLYSYVFIVAQKA